MTLLLSSGKFDNFRTYLEKNGYTFEDRPYQLYLAKKSGIVINLYSNGKIVVGGADQAERTRVEEFLGSLEASQFEKPIKEYPAIQVSGSRIGTDEVGKGDYFGPLVIGGVAADEAQSKQFQDLGVKDSKTLSDTTINNLAVQIRKILRPNQNDVIVIGPLKYNMLHKEMGNVNGILGWGHARAIENLVITNPT
jgi:ribonuclease HIII